MDLDKINEAYYKHLRLLKESDPLGRDPEDIDPDNEYDPDIHGPHPEDEDPEDLEKNEDNEGEQTDEYVIFYQTSSGTNAANTVQFKDLCNRIASFLNKGLQITGVRKK